MAYNNIEQSQPMVKHAADLLAAGAGGSALTGMITGWGGALAAVLTVCWFAYQIYDLWERRRNRKHIHQKKKPR